MDAIDITSPDLVTSDADENETETIGFGKEVAKTLAVSTATSAGVFAGFVVIALATPKVQAWFAARKKKDDVVVVEETVTDASPETPETKKD